MKPNNPPLTLVDPGATAIAPPPRPVGIHGKALWDSVQSIYRVDDPAGVEILTQACAALDRAEALAERINVEGEVLTTRGGVKEHPALKSELANRSFVCKMLEKLGLNIEIVRPTGRQPSSFGWKGPHAD